LGFGVGYWGFRKLNLMNWRIKHWELAALEIGTGEYGIGKSRILNLPSRPIHVELAIGSWELL